MTKWLAGAFCLVCIFIYSAASSQAYHYYFGNIHAHSSYSDGNKDAAAGVIQTPAKNFEYARNTYNFNFLGISEHNHSGAGMHLPDYRKGLADADSCNKNGQFVCMYGMEYGVISNGGHVVIYGIDSLIGWESGNYDIYTPEYDYTSLWKIIAGKPNAIATLAHPENTDYNNLLTAPYSDTADMAIFGCAVRSGAAFSTTTDYSDGPPSSVYTSYFRKLLAAGYKLGPTLDHDNHYMTFGRTAQSRTVVLAETLHRDSIMAAYRAMRFYASDDWNTQVNFTINGYPLGSTINVTGNPTINVNVTDPDVTDTTLSIKLYYGVPGSNTLSTVLTSNANSNNLSFVHNINSASSYYYYLEITQTDGDKIWTAPIWVTKAYSLLPIDAITLKGSQKQETIQLQADLTNTDYIQLELEKSFKGTDYSTIAMLTGQTQIKNRLTFIDNYPAAGYQYYRLKCTHKDGSVTYSSVAAVMYNDNSFALQTLYPNPAVQKINLSITAKKPATALCKLYNAEGRLMTSSTKSLSEGANVISQNIEMLSTGLYHLVVEVQDAKLESSFLKQ
jgi:hypothetical protein